ncbi:MAG TPA: elongation factor P maturation arginine rhamnosyltransferase EarP [Methylophilaceae bacterium]
MTLRRHWDIFCRVIDNFGDIGVCWRLARQLAHEHRLDIRLWVDDLESAQRILPALDLAQPAQWVDGVAIHHWLPEFTFDRVADVVIEAFACDLPQPYLQAMVDRRPIWLNLEYLSAEPWVEEYHLQPSPHPRLPLRKTFFFPGFTEHTGGLLRESGLLEARDAFMQRHQQSGIDHLPLQVSLFCYPDAPIRQLLTSMAEGPRPVFCRIPSTGILPAVSDFFGASQLHIGHEARRGQLTVEILPFLSQDAYDRLLWSCDLNFVRGEDSWIRAIWAARPFIWQPYRQQEDTHLAKLRAFLKHYRQDCEHGATAVLEQFHHAWTNGNLETAHWQRLLQSLPTLRTHAALRSEILAQQPDLASKLVIFCENS